MLNNIIKQSENALSQILLFLIIIIFLILSSGCGNKTENTLVNKSEELSDTENLTEPEEMTEQETLTEAETLSDELINSFSLKIDGLDTNIEILFSECTAEYDMDNIQVYSYFVDETESFGSGYALYIRTPKDSMQIFPVKEYLIDKNNGALYMIWDTGSFERIQGIDFVLNSDYIGGYKIQSIYGLEDWLGNAYGLEMNDSDRSFSDLHAEFTGLYEKNNETLLRGIATGLYNNTGKTYSIEWEINMTTNKEKVKAYPM